MSPPLYPPRPGDKLLSELQETIEHLLSQNPATRCFLKWTCPTCGERVTADQPNAIHLGGYYHTEKDDGSPCGSLYTGTYFGLLLVLGIGRVVSLGESDTSEKENP